MKSGQYRTTEPGSAEWYDAMYVQPLKNAGAGLRDFLSRYDGDPSTNPGDLSQQQSSALGQQPVPNRVPPNPNYTKEELAPAAAAERSTPVAQTLLSDDANSRASEARRMLQQATPYWEREENAALKAAAESGPRAGEAGYAQRADIQAWMEAQRAKGPAGAAMVDRFLAKQANAGLIEETANPGFGGTRINVPQGEDADATASRAQAMRTTAGGATAVQEAQDSVNRIQAQDTAALMQKVLSGEIPPIEGFSIGNTPGSIRNMNASNAFATQPVDIQEVAKDGFQPFQGLGLFKKYAEMVGGKQ